MMNAMRAWGGLVFVLTGFAVAPAWGQSEQLAKGRELFQHQHYSEAQDVLLHVDRDKLSADEVAELDRILAEIPTAIQSGKRAEQDRADADKAFGAGRWDEADRLYHAVMNNQYATGQLRQTAADQIQRIDEKRRLSQQGSAGAAADEPVMAVRMDDDGLPPPARESSVLQELRNRDELLWNRAVAKMQEAAERAGEAIAADNYDEARRQAETAIQVIEASRNYAQPPARYEAARAEAQRIRDSVERSRADFEVRKAAAEREEITEAIKLRREREEQQRREKVEQLFNTAAQLRKEQKYSEAAEAIRQVLYIDPGNARAGYLLDLYEDFASVAQQKSIDRSYDVQSRDTFTEADSTRIPWTYDILYPKNWSQISSRRRGVEHGIGLPEENSELNRRLDTVQPDINFQETGFEQVLSFLQDLNKLNLAVDWEDLTSHNIERDKPVTLKLRDVSLRTVMRELLSQVGGDVKLGYSIGDGLLRIASKEKLDKSKFVLVYDIRDLLARARNFFGPQIDVTQQQQGGGGQGGGSQQIFTGGQQQQQQQQQNQAGGETPQELADITRLIDIIRGTVEPDSWRDTGAGDGAIREMHGQLIIYNTSDAHRQVRDLLGQLREARDLMISVEGRFLTVSNNFLEEIGVDLDFVFNGGNAGYDRAFNTNGVPLTDPFTGANVLVPRPYSRAGVTPAIPGGGNPIAQTAVAQPYGQAGFVPQQGSVSPHSSEMTPITGQQGSLNLADPGGINTGVPGSFSSRAQPALNIAGSFLDNLQVDFLIRATLANRRSSVVQAPRLMLFNGQNAFVTVVRSRSYVASLTTNVAQGAVAVAPNIQNINSGVTMNVQGTINADRRYVRLTVQMGLSDEPAFTTFEIQRASGNSPGLFVLLPDQQRRIVNSTVSVPDGGTVLLGGLKQTGETEIEAGVPILSKIPVLKRAFTNTTTVKDTQTLLILLKAKILIQSEAENEAFPTLAPAVSG